MNSLCNSFVAEGTDLRKGLTNSCRHFLGVWFHAAEALQSLGVREFGIVDFWELRF